MGFWRSIDERNALVEDNFNLTYYIINKFFHSKKKRRYLSDDDALSAASMGLMKAATDFDPAKGHQFSTFATRCIFNEIRRAVFNETIIRIPETVQYASAKGFPRFNQFKTHIEIALKVRLFSAMSQLDLPPAEPLDEKYDSSVFLTCRKFLNLLTLKEQTVILARFSDMTLEEIGKTLSLSRERIRQIETVAMDKLKVMFGMKEAA